VKVNGVANFRTKITEGKTCAKSYLDTPKNYEKELGGFSVNNATGDDPSTILG